MILTAYNSRVFWHLRLFIYFLFQIMLVSRRCITVVFINVEVYNLRLKAYLADDY